MWGELGGQPLNAKLPTDNVYFYGPGAEINLGRGLVRWPLVYATGAPRYGQFDASLIDGTLPVAPQGTSVGEQLPYWPSYYDCSPAQRSRYLDWLLTGKQDPRIELGYVFIYFYGLERRVVVDRDDYLPVAQEIIRLIRLYSYSNSFRRYSSRLLWLTLFLMTESSGVPEALFQEALEVTGRWDEELLGICLAVLHAEQKPVPARLALKIAEHDPRSTSSVIVRRHREHFENLFVKRYSSQFNNGMLLRAGKRATRIDYRPASATLHSDEVGGYKSSLPTMPNVFAISSQFKPLLHIWGESIDDLRAYSRAHRSSGDKLTAEAYEALPPELRNGEHPESDAWLQVWQDHVDGSGWPIVPISSLATIKTIQRRDKLTKSQCNKLLQTADAVGLGIEPDARRTGRNYRWTERVALFFLDDELSENTPEYNCAAVLLRLGASIAEADGHVDAVELTYISEHLEGQFNLSDSDSKRLERLQYLLLHSQSGDNSISTALAKRLSRDQRLIIGEFLVGVAAADEVITREEMTALRKAYRALDLDVADLEELVQRHIEPESEADPSRVQQQELRLDMHAISRIMTETHAVAGILRDAMAEEDDEECPEWESDKTAVAVAEPPEESLPLEDNTLISRPDGLDPRYQPFLTAITERREWTSSDLREVADSNQVMLGGAIEAINEWSTEQFGDWLIEEGDVFHIHVELIEESE